MPDGETPYCYKYPRPAVTVDLVLFALDGEDLKVLFIRRKHDPFGGSWAFPGGFLEMDETLEAAARRELVEETGVAYRGPLATLGVYADPLRDPRGRTISVAHAAVVGPPPPKAGGGDDAAEAAWLRIPEARPLAFDHDQILRDGLAWLRRAMEEGPTGLAMLPRGFDDGHVKALFRALGVTTRRAAAWRNRLLREGAIASDARAPGRYRSSVGQASRLPKK